MSTQTRPETRTMNDMVNRRVRGGANAKESQELLDWLVHAYSSKTLATALVYHGFATELQAQRFTA